MLRILLPVILGIVGVSGGVAAGIFLKPPSHEDLADNSCNDPTEAGEEASFEVPQKEEETVAPEGEIVKLNNQFIVPVLKKGRVASMVVLSVSLEVVPGTREDVYAREPKLRDAFLGVLFDHANKGGFDGTFTSGANLASLRRALMSSAEEILADGVYDVLFTDIARQDS